jgi:hypothetical protein
MAKSLMYTPMKAYGWNGVTVKLILNFGTRRRFGLPHAPVTVTPVPIE